MKREKQLLWVTVVGFGIASVLLIGMGIDLAGLGGTARGDAIGGALGIAAGVFLLRTIRP